MIRASAIVLAAGSGRRFKSSLSKPLVKIGPCPMIIYSLKALNRHPYVKDIVVVANPLNRNDLSKEISKYRISKVKNIVLGGKQRQDSVRCGLKPIDKESSLVLIHDGARPFIDKEMLSTVIKEAARHGAAIVGVPVKATIKEAVGLRSPAAGNPSVKKTLDRKSLWEVQTPQVFKKDLILEAFKRFGAIQVTDDASLVERLGVKVRIVMGSYYNIKVTTFEDLVLARAISKNRRS